MKNADLIQEIEKVKSTLTQAQKALEDSKLQEAEDYTVSAILQLKPIITTFISKLFQ